MAFALGDNATAGRLLRAPAAWRVDGPFDGWHPRGTTSLTHPNGDPARNYMATYYRQPGVKEDRNGLFPRSDHYLLRTIQLICPSL